MPNGWIVIEVEGGSVSLKFDSEKLRRDPSDPKKYSDPNLRLKKVEVFDGDQPLFSNEFADGKATIRVYAE